MGMAGCRDLPRAAASGRISGLLSDRRAPHRMATSGAARWRDRTVAHARGLWRLIPSNRPPTMHLTALSAPPVQAWRRRFVLADTRTAPQVNPVLCDFGA